MSKIVEYKIVMASRYSDLSDLVNISIMKGWKPVGGVGVNRNFYQAMVLISVDDLKK